MEIRVFANSDSQAVISLWQRCALTVPWNDPHKDIQRKLAVQPELFLVGVLNGIVIGSVMGGYDGHRGWIYYLAVDPDHQHHGYGSQLVTEVENRIMAMGCPKINLMVRTGNRAVLDFYTNLGYQPDEIVGLGKRLVPDL